MKRTVSAIILMMLLFGMITLAFNIQLGKAGETIYIRPNGSVEGTDKIHRDGDVYTFTDNIYDSIVIEKDNIVVDGAGYTVQGTGSGNGIYFSGRSNITIKNTNINNFNTGIRLVSSSNYNSVSGNNIANNDYGIMLYSSSNNTISGNNITANNEYGTYLYSSSDNTIFHNNVINNTNQVYSSDSVNTWDDGYPSGGNYWSDYEERYPNATEINDSSIWNTPYVIDANNKDNYPIIPEFPSGVILPLFMMVTLIAVLLLRRKRRILCSRPKEIYFGLEQHGADADQFC